MIESAKMAGVKDARKNLDMEEVAPCTRKEVPEVYKSLDFIREHITPTGGIIDHLGEKPSSTSNKEADVEKRKRV